MTGHSKRGHWTSAHQPAALGPAQCRLCPGGGTVLPLSPGPLLPVAFLLLCRAECSSCDRLHPSSSSAAPPHPPHCVCPGIQGLSLRLPVGHTQVRPLFLVIPRHQQSWLPAPSCCLFLWAAYFSKCWHSQSWLLFFSNISLSPFSRF